MSNFTDFFPTAAAAGTAEITSPDKLPIRFIGTTSTVYLEELWHSLYTYTSSTKDSASVQDPIIGTNFLANAYSGQAVQSVNGTEYTLVNISSGSGYLCNVTTAIGNNGAFGSTLNQKIVIIVDGTTYTYDYNSGSDTYYDGFYNRLFWGFFASGSDENANRIGGGTNSGLLALGGTPAYVSTLPPLYYQSGSVSYQRVFSAPEFKQYNLPRLRFESSLVVKVTTSDLYTTTGWAATAGATYYLDTSAI